VNSLPKTVTRQRRGCDLNPGPAAPESSTLTTRLLSHPADDFCEIKKHAKVDSPRTPLGSLHRSPMSPWLVGRGLLCKNPTPSLTLRASLLRDSSLLTALDNDTAARGNGRFIGAGGEWSVCVLYDDSIEICG